MEYKDYYQILGVARNADEKTIKRAYRELVKKLHPDTNVKDKTLEAKMRDVNEAYSVLSNPEKRAKYDQLGANWEELSRQAEASSGSQSTADYDLGSAPFSDFFRAFFGDQGFDIPGYTTTTRRTRKRKGEDLYGSVQISLEEAFHGSMREIQVDFGGNKKSLSVKIPPGIENGTRIRLRDQGYPGSSGGEPGNLYLEVQISSHPTFERRGNDLYTEIPITLSEAMLGARIEVPSLKGKVLLVVPPETQNATTFRLKGLGMPPKGDQYVKVKVILPDRLNSEQKRLFEELGQYEHSKPRACLGLE
jgi:DnaJ-class molecular chaperone